MRNAMAWRRCVRLERQRRAGRSRRRAPREPRTPRHRVARWCARRSGSSDEAETPSPTESFTAMPVGRPWCRCSRPMTAQRSYRRPS